MNKSSIEALVARISPEALQEALGAAFLVKVASLTGVGIRGDEPSAEWLARCALSIFSYDIFSQKQVRKGLLRLLPDAELNRIARTYVGRTFPKREDNVLAIASLGWKRGVGIVEELARVFMIPSEYLPRKVDPVPGTELVDPFVPISPLHEYQVAVKDQIVEALLVEPATILLQMPTGSGKTRTAVQALCEYLSGNSEARQIVWLAHAEELCEQAFEALERVWQNVGNRPLRIARLWGSHDPAYAILGEGAVIASLQKMYSMFRQNDQRAELLAQRSGVVVVDEAHKLMARTYRLVVDRLRSHGTMGLLGLTATPGRNLDCTQENVALAHLFGKNIVRPFDGQQEVMKLQGLGILAKLSRKVIESNVDVSLTSNEKSAVDDGLDLSPTLLSKLSSSAKRNSLIMEIVAGEVRSGRPTVVFTCTREHAAVLSSALNMNGIPSAFVDCEMDRDVRAEAIRRYKRGEVNVLLNFGVLTTGFDAPRTRTVMITRPTASVVLYGQMIGRALRGPRMGGGENSVLIDVKDNFLNYGGVEEVYSAFNEYWL